MKYLIITENGEIILKTEYTKEIEYELQNYLSKKQQETQNA